MTDLGRTYPNHSFAYSLRTRLGAFLLLSCAAIVCAWNLPAAYAQKLSAFDMLTNSGPLKAGKIGLDGEKIPDKKLLDVRELMNGAKSIEKFQDKVVITGENGEFIILRTDKSGELQFWSLCDWVPWVCMPTPPEGVHQGQGNIGRDDAQETAEGIKE